MSKQQQKECTALLTDAHNTYQKGLNLYAFFKVHDRITSEELVQNTFMKAWIYLCRGGKINTMKAFLYHIINNLIIDEYRKNKNMSLETLLEKGFEPSVDEIDTLYDTIDGKRAMSLIPKLPHKYKDVMLMRYTQSLTLKEISSITKQSRNTIAVQLHRGLEKLKLSQEFKYVMNSYSTI